ncbi:MAG: GTP-binding protein [Candidatus Njordarchaeales archaeon]
MVYIARDGSYRFKVILYGPSLSGKTTMLRSFKSMNPDKVAKVLSIEQDDGRTIFFDYTTVQIHNNIYCDVYAAPGQKRHRKQRIILLKGVDGIIFVADSDPRAIRENLESMNELKTFFGSRFKTIPLVIALNKRDLIDALPITVILRVLNLDRPFVAYPTIAIRGTGIEPVFRSAIRLTILSKLAPSIYRMELLELSKKEPYYIIVRGKAAEEAIYQVSRYV